MSLVLESVRALMTPVVLVAGLVVLFLMVAGATGQWRKTCECALATASYWTLAFVMMPTTDVRGKSKRRTGAVDAAKAMANVGLIFTHWCYYNLDQTAHLALSDEKTWLNGGAKTELMAALRIVNWCVPLACVCSGMVAQKSRSWRRWLETTVLPTILWEYGFKPIIYDGAMDLIVLGRTSFPKNFPVFHREWFLEALIVWRAYAMIPMSRKARVIVGFGASALAGYHQCRNQV